jgi:chromosomal replication initiation ATPase DnaA
MKRNIFNDYVEQVVELYGITKGELFQKSKVREVVDARHVLYYLCYNRPMKLKYIQKYMSEAGYDIGHSSVLHGIQAVTNLVQSDEDISFIIETLQGE